MFRRMNLKWIQDIKPTDCPLCERYPQHYNENKTLTLEAHAINNTSLT